MPTEKGLFGFHPIKGKAVWDLESEREHNQPNAQTSSVILVLEQVFKRL